MANYTVPSQHGKEIPLQTQDRDHLSALDVVWANKFDGEMIDPTHAMEMEFEFYRGAPPQWLNFYWAEHENSQFVKRDMYQKLKEKINEFKTKRWSIAHINLFHDPGSGGSTLAMQVLWDLRKKLRCAKLLDSMTDTKAIAQQVLRLFRAGGSEKQNTVLLLTDNKKYTSEDTSFRDNLEENLCDLIKANNINATIPVVIILSCLHQIDLAERTDNVTLSSSLSKEEQGNFERKQSEIIKKFGSRHSQLYAFNIMLSNYDSSYVTNICSVLPPLKKKRRSRKQQLLAFLALINSYVPSSDLPHDLCQMFIQRKGNDLYDFSLKQHLQPFSDFLVIFSAKEEEVSSEDTHVRMAHPMIARECLRLLKKAGVTKSDTTLNLLRYLCRDNMPLCLVKTLKKLLTKRESRQHESDKSKVVLDKFSKLILDIHTEEKRTMCVAVLKLALKKFAADPYFPQVLARFYYIKNEDYANAKHWAEVAIIRDEKNSFIRDTLGQVNKNCLKNIISKEKLPLKDKEAYARKILQHGKKATEVFKAEQDVAVEETPEMQEHGMTSISTIFNNRGIFGYMQVANIIFENIITVHEEWPKVLTKEITPHRFLNSYGGGKCEKYKSFITSLRDEVEDKFEFFEWYLLYSKPSINKEEPNYFRPEVVKCYRNFVTQSLQNKSAIQMLKERMASTFAGLLCPDQDAELKLITEHWKEMYSDSPSDVENIQNYIVANIMLSQMNDTSLAPLNDLQSMLRDLWTKQKDRRSPEFYLLVLLLFWPDAQQSGFNSPDIAECVRYMHRSFETKYKNYLRSRYLVPLFFFKTGHGLQRLIHMSCLDKNVSNLLSKGCEIQQLRRVNGEVENYKVFYVEGPERIEVSPSHPASVRGQGNVSFYLGFNIKGPVAYNIRYKQ